jgi:hypothetical protein
MTAEVEPREQLRLAIAERDTTAKEAARLAAETTERARGLLTTAQTRLAAFGDVDGEILAHRAASFKGAAQGGPKPSLALPDDLVRRERARDEAASAVAAAKVAYDTLSGELATAENALRKAELAVSEKAGAVLVAEIAEQGRSLIGIWGGLWATIDELNALRASLLRGVNLPPDIVRTLNSFEGMDHRQFPGNRNKQLARAAQFWRAYHVALVASADATAPNSIDDGEFTSSAAVVERVA